MSARSVKEAFDDCGFDFYTAHPYGTDITKAIGGWDDKAGKMVEDKSFEDFGKALSSKPLIFTEWGGNYVHDNTALYTRYCQEIFRLWDKGLLAGASYWVWADYHEDNRDVPSNLDGVTLEGLVDMERRPRANYNVMAKELAARKYPKTLRYKIDAEKFEKHGNTYTPLVLSADNAAGQEALWEEVKAPWTGNVLVQGDKTRNMPQGPKLPEEVHRLGELPVYLKKGIPFIATEQQPLTLKIEGAAAECAWIIGNVTLTEGYPVSGEFGELTAEYELLYDDGSVQTVPLRNGMEMAHVHCIHQGSVINPLGTEICGALTLSYNPSWEIYKLHLFKLPLDKSKVLTGFTIRAKEGYTPLVYGITLQL